MLGRRRWWIAIAVLAAAGFGTWQATAELRLHWLLSALQTQLLQAEPAERDALAAQLVACGPHGWPTLAETMAADDPGVRGAAQRAILGQIADWERAADAPSRKQLLHFAAELPELAQGLPERGQCGAAVVARRLLVTRMELSLADRERMLSACAETLRLPGAALPPDDFVDLEMSSLTADAPPPLEQPLLVARVDASRHEEAPAVLLPEAALEPSDSSLSSLRAPEETSELATEPVRESATSNAPATVRDPGEEEELQFAAPEALEEGTEAIPLKATPAPNNIAAQELESRLAKMPTAWTGLLRAFCQSLSNDASVRTAALAELRQRLVTERELNVATQLHALDPEVRQEWVRALPGLRGIDSPFWLTWMCTDPAEEVRRTAVEVAATAQDPELWQRVRGLAQGDPATAIRQLATTLQAQRASVAREGAERLR